MKQFFRPYFHKSDKHLDFFLKEHTSEDSLDFVRDVFCLIPLAHHCIYYHPPRSYENKDESFYVSTAKGLANFFGAGALFPPFFLLASAILTVALAFDIIKEAILYTIHTSIMASRIIATALFLAYSALQCVAQVVSNVSKVIRQAHDTNEVAEAGHESFESVKELQGHENKSNGKKDQDNGEGEDEDCSGQVLLATRL